VNARVLINLITHNDIKTLSDLFRIWRGRGTGRIPANGAEIFYGKISDAEVLAFEPVKEPVVTIIIPAYNQWDYTYSCLYSVLRNTGGVPYDVIVADDKSEDETRNILNHVRGIKLIRSEKNLGFLRTCNRAAREAAGKYILFLNNDTNVQKGWLSSLLETMESDDRIGLVGAKLLFPDGRLQDAGGIIWKDASCWIYGRWDDPEKKEYNVVRDVDYISGASLLTRKELWQEIGGFDERYSPAYYEDTDLALEVRKRGYRVVYQPRAEVVHFEGASCGTDERSGIKRYQRINKEKFFRKWEQTLKGEYQEPGTIRLRAAK